MPEERERELCPEVIRLQVQMENMFTWRDQWMARFESLERAVDDLNKSQSRGFIAILTLMLSGFLAMIAGLLYIILNHALL